VVLHRGAAPSPTRSAVLVRLSHGHIRIGTFQRLAHSQDTENLQRLTGYVLRHYYGEEAGDDAPQRLLAHVAARTARMAGRFMAAGFVHGVLNSDNINVTGESFDYGPWRFAPSWAPGFTAAYFDQSGLYSFGRQPEAIYWDVMQLASSLRLISEEEPLIEAMEVFPETFQREVAIAMLWRLGVVPRGPEFDRPLIGAIEAALVEADTPIDRFFFDGFGGKLPESYGEPFAALRAQLTGYEPRKPRDHEYWSDPAPCAMLIDEVEAIWAAIAQGDDWAPLTAKVAAIRRMGEALR
jgi:uncharacterized protein YdiU (UPF0061 family)